MAVLLQQKGRSEEMLTLGTGLLRPDLLIFTFSILSSRLHLLNIPVLLDPVRCLCGVTWPKMKHSHSVLPVHRHPDPGTLGGLQNSVKIQHGVTSPCCFGDLSIGRRISRHRVT